MNGFLLIDKPKGQTSADCVYTLRNILNTKKIGHCGTLDPIATGMLPICIGEGTKFSNYISNHSKKYEVTVLFGIETDSGDITGKEISKNSSEITENDLKEALSSFEGEIKQTPPMHSAIKFQGKPLYKWVRAGIYLKRDERNVSISKLEIKSFVGNTEAVIKVSCSKGTYIRSLVESIGKKINTIATIKELRRISVGEFKEEDLTLLESKEKSFYQQNLINLDQALKGLPKILLDKIEVKKIRNGQKLDYNAREQIEGIVRLYEKEGFFIGLGNIDSSKRVSAKRLLTTK
ncbi:MAG: tRNA pseudouridine(55) synthase TruB [Gammaproteobacteria bacterium]